MKRKVIFLIHSLNIGGMERVVSELLNQYSNNENLELHLVLFDNLTPIFYTLPSTIIIHRPVFEFSNHMRTIYSIRIMLFIRKTLSKINADAIISFGEFWNNLVLLSAIGKKLPIFISDRSQPGKPLGHFHESLRKQLYPKAKGIIAQTQTAKMVLLEKTRHTNIQVIGNPVAPIAIEDKIKKEKIILSVGRLIHTKHHDSLIKLFVKLNLPDWKLVIVGDDGLKQKNKVNLEKLIHDLDAEDKIILAGKRTNISDFYLKSEIFAFMSSSEGFPNVLGEALSAGLPVISFDCVAGPSEIIEDGYNGFLIPLFDYALYEQKLMSLITDANLRNLMAKNARLSIEKFSSHHIANEYLKTILPNEDFAN